jgi:DNA-binding transcriptional MerR regulator
MQGDVQASGRLRIGELSRRSGVSVELLRAWERRYGLLTPARTEGGFRLYGAEDERRVMLMGEHLAAGLSAAEAARLALASPPAAEPEPPDGARVEQHGDALRDALDRFDEPGAQAVIDRAVAEFTLDAVLREIVLPYLHELGDRWARGEASIGQEHFAASVIRGRLLGFGREWGAGSGPRALLACVPGEVHDLALICFGLALRSRGWRITYLGIDTPVSTLAETAGLLRPAIVVVNVVVASPGPGERMQLSALAGSHRLAVAGPGATAELAASIGAERLQGDPVTAAESVTAAPVGSTS